MHTYHSRLEAALTAANKQGERNRKRERWQLFKVPMDEDDSSDEET